MITLGIPTLNRYDLLKLTIESAEKGEVKPDKYVIVDNGGKFEMDEFYSSLGDRLQVVNFGRNIGCAAAWNKIISLSDDIRIIANDDVVFYPDTIRLLAENFNQDVITFPAGMPAANVFSCFVIPNNIVEVVGLFDEKISPNYAYFEDNDYYRRTILAGKGFSGVGDCRLDHETSSTHRALEEPELSKHHERFKRAEKNYIRKWGGVPGHEMRTVPQEL